MAYSETFVEGAAAGAMVGPALRRESGHVGGRAANRSSGRAGRPWGPPGSAEPPAGNPQAAVPGGAAAGEIEALGSVKHVGHAWQEAVGFDRSINRGPVVKPPRRGIREIEERCDICSGTRSSERE